MSQLGHAQFESKPLAMFVKISHQRLGVVLRSLRDHRNRVTFAAFVSGAKVPGYARRLRIHFRQRNELGAAS
jgi:hypothetical protein